MGYRSEVSWCLQVKKPESFVALLKLRTNDVLKEMMEHMYLDDGFIHFYHNHWKWYEDSQKVLDDIMEMAESYDEEFAGKFARYGEESDDMVEDAWGELGWELEYPHLVRDIELGFDPNKAKKLIREEANGSE